MAEKTVEYKIRIKDVSGDTTGQIRKSLEGLGMTVESVEEKSKRLNSALINFNQTFQVIDNLNTSIQRVSSTFSELTNYSQQQAEADARLEQVMRNTMNASDAEVQSIKDLASAQQKLGVVGDEVQIAGAQELATYMSKKKCLEDLIPVMNDIVAQQYGYTATAEGAVNIATMMGKVFTGQVSALSRYGYTFDEAQEKILKYGTEEEKAATLAEVVEQSVGGVNQALAQTPTGKFVQISNEIGDFKETIGAAIIDYQPFITILSETGTAALGFIQLGQSIGTVANSMKALNLTFIASPIGLIVTAVAALAAGLIYAYKNSEDFRNVVDSAWQTLKDFMSVVWQIAQKAFKELISALKPVISWMKDLGSVIMKYVVGQIKLMIYGLKTVVGWLRKLFGIKDTSVADTIDDATQKLLAAGEAARTVKEEMNGGGGGGGGTSGDETKGQNKTYDAGTIGAYAQAISQLREEEKGASLERMSEIEREIRGLENLKKAAENAAIARSYNVNSSSIAPAGIGVPAVKIDIDVETSNLTKMSDKIKKSFKKTFDNDEPFENAQKGINGIASTMSNLGGIIGGVAGGWLEWGANVAQAIAQAIPQIVALTGVQKANSGANFLSAATGAMASESAIPIVGPILGIAAMAAVIAAMLAIPKFANGGIAYGPTLGMFGEYSGASSNPEVVAPLDKLQSMIDTGDRGVGNVVFRISGRDLEGVLDKRSRYNERIK